MKTFDLLDPLLVGWISVLLGLISGAVIGLFFHREDWLGGYDSYRRRLFRLGHISFFGLGTLNILYGLSGVGDLRSALLLVASNALMPVCCFLSAWRKPFRHLFPLPVLSAIAGVAILLLDWRIR